MNTKKKDYSKRIAIDLNEEQYNKLQEYCLRNKLTKAEVIRESVSKLNKPINDLTIDSFHMNTRLFMSNQRIDVKTLYGYLCGIFEILDEYQGLNESEIKHRICRKINNYMEKNYPHLLKELENYAESVYDSFVIYASTADLYYMETKEEDKVY